MIGDLVDFNGDEPWWVTWVGPPPEDVVAGRTYPPVNPYVHEIADQAKRAFAEGSQIISVLQYRLAELAGIGQLDREESMDLQGGLVELYEVLYRGTLCAVRDWTTSDWTWDEADNTYSDGRQVINQVRIEPWEHSDDCWEHNRFMLGDGAPNEFPLGTISYISPRYPEVTNDGRGAVERESVESLRERLKRHLDD
jgi:hypothetical protein